jgi:hypothetical protein
VSLIFSLSHRQYIDFSRLCHQLQETCLQELKIIQELKLSPGLKYNEEGSPVLFPKKQLESNESEFEGCWGAKNPTPDELHDRVSGCTST